MEVSRLNSTATIPSRAYMSSAGFDLYSCQEHLLPQNHPVKINTQIAIALPPGTFGLITGRSSYESANIRCVPGIIDEDYRGALIVVLINQSKKVQVIREFHKIAQLLILPVITPDLIVKSTLVDTLRGDNGFGSSGA